MNLLKITTLLMFCATIAYTQEKKPNTSKKSTDLKFGIAFIGAGLIGLRGLNKENRWWKKINDESANEFAAKYKIRPTTPPPLHSKLSRAPFWGSTLFGAYLLSKGLLAKYYSSTKYYSSNWLMTTKKFRRNGLGS